MEKTKVVRTRFSKLSISKHIELEDGNKDSATLTWSTRNGYPRITVYTSNKKASSPDGKMNWDFIITAPFDYITLQMFLSNLKDIIDGPNEKRSTINCYNTKYENGNKTNDVELQAKVIVGKDRDGVVYLTAIEEGKRSVKFDLLPSTIWFKFFDTNNNEITDKAVLSKAYANGYYNVMSKLLLDAAKDELVRTVESEDKPKNTPTVSNTKQNEITVSDIDLENLL